MRSLSRLIAPTSTPRNTTRKPMLEALEDRSLMTVSAIAGTLVIEGTVANDTALVQKVNVAGSQFYQVTLNGAQQLISATLVFNNQMVFRGFAGDDYFSNQTDTMSTAWGGDGKDYLMGGSNSDVLYGEAGNDVVLGQLGNDVLEGGTGDDYIDGAAGNDFLFGRQGKDLLIGGEGDDYLDGGKDHQKDQLYGGLGKDKFVRDMIWIFNIDKPKDFSAVQGDKII
jgi:Ca2+-binding RTX toxin-like protein